MKMVRQTAALICCHAAPYGVMVYPSVAKEIALNVHVDIEVPLGYRCVNTEVLNVRSGPIKETKLLHQIPRGLRVELWGCLGDWGFVMWDDGEGWVSMDYLGDCPASSKAFHAALEVDTGPVVTYDHGGYVVDTERPPRSDYFPVMRMREDTRWPGWFIVGETQGSSTVRGGLRALVGRCLQGFKKFADRCSGRR